MQFELIAFFKAHESTPERHGRKVVAENRAVAQVHAFSSPFRVHEFNREVSATFAIGALLQNHWGLLQHLLLEARWPLVPVPLRGFPRVLICAIKRLNSILSIVDLTPIGSIWGLKFSQSSECGMVGSQ